VAERLAQYYGSVETLATIDAPTGPRSSRRYCIFKLSGARATIVPLTAAPR
jgi:hypothetical protein